MGEHKTNPNRDRPTCESGCPHFTPNNANRPDQGYHCRRYPPTMVMGPVQDALGNMQVGIRSHWPPISPNAWCGEHPDFLRWSMQRGRAAAVAEEPACVQ